LDQKWPARPPSTELQGAPIDGQDVIFGRKKPVELTEKWQKLTKKAALNASFALKIDRKHPRARQRRFYAGSSFTKIWMPQVDDSDGVKVYFSNNLDGLAYSSRADKPI
jgi:hypothetical protein